MQWERDLKIRVLHKIDNKRFSILYDLIRTSKTKDNRENKKILFE